jgi:precorrin-3B synthase
MRVGESFCPGILHAVEAKDGLLTRIRVPGGMITAFQLEVIADLAAAYSNGQVEITSRSNLQLRAIRQNDLHYVVKELESAGLLPSAPHDRVRNVITSPFAGLGFDEILDSRPFVAELDRRLVSEQVLAGLPPKFSFAIDGGGGWFSRDSDDLAFQAVTVDEAVRFHLVVGGVSSGLGVRVDQVVECAIQAAKACLQISEKFGIPARGKKIAVFPQAMDELLSELSDLLVYPSSSASKIITEMPVGVYLTEQVGLVSLVPSVPLGRLASEQIRCVTAVAKEWGEDIDIRLAPWRGIVLGPVPEDSLSQVAEKLQSVSLRLDGKDGYRGIAVCAGNTGCDASLADVRSDATLLASLLSGHEAKPGWTVNISGCGKQCAMRNGATAELIASPSGYDLRFNGRELASGCSLDFVITTLIGNQAVMISEASS